MNDLFEKYEERLDARKKEATTIYPDHLRKTTKPYNPTLVAIVGVVFIILSALYLGVL